MKLTAILIDDERKALAIIKDKLKRLCPQVEIIAETQDSKEAIHLLKDLKPQLVFLDVAMPELSGFDILAEIDKPTFEIIFATAFDNYAIDAIKHCAIGYLVKPIDNNDLVNAVAKATENILEKNALEKNEQLIKNLGIKTFRDKKIIIPTQGGLEFIEISTILFCEGADGYTKIHVKDKKPLLSSQSIGSFIKMLNSNDFYHVHKSYFVNLHHIDKYLNEGYITVKNQNIPVSRNRRASFIELLRTKN